MENFGFWTILPIVFVIIFSLKTKKTMLALLLGTMISYIIVSGTDFLGSWTEAMYQAASDHEHIWVFLVCGLFGSLITLITASHGTLAFARWLEKRCKNDKSTLITTWLLGIVIFIDDYLNILTLSTCMKRVSDKRKIPREALAYVIDSTGAPVCVLLPFSTWAIFFATLFYQEAGVAELGYGDALQTYLHVIPYIFYALIAVILVPLFILNVIPKLGGMKKAYARVAETGRVYDENDESLNAEDKISEQAEDLLDAKSSNQLDFLVPIGALIVITLLCGELLYAIMGALLICLLMYVPRRKMDFEQFCSLTLAGFCNMIPTLGIIFAAFIMQQAMNDIGIASFVIETLEPFLSAGIFPVLAFIATALLTFSTGSSWGIPAICIPILMPLGFSLGAAPLLVMAAIVSGSTLGSHACFYSDATVLTSSCCKIKNMEHAVSQLPYATTAACLCASSYLVFGMAWV